MKQTVNNRLTTVKNVRILYYKNVRPISVRISPTFEKKTAVAQLSNLIAKAVG